jgi:hypothetical protein
VSQLGIRCPKCNCMHTKVYKTLIREVRWGGQTHTHTRRYRECRYCLTTWSTVEVMEDKKNLGFPNPDITPEPKITKKPQPHNPYLRLSKPDEEETA